MIKTNKNSPPKRRNKNNNNNIIAQTSKKTFGKKLKPKRIYDDNELNELPFLESIKSDTRTFSKIYFSLLKTNHSLLFTFCNNNDYNSKAIKLYLFLFFFIHI